MASPSPKPLLRALAGEPMSPPPWWLMRQAGRYLPEYREVRSRAPDFVELCLTPALAAELTLQPIRRFGMDAAILFSDILLLPHALGQGLAYRDGEGPVLEPVVDNAGAARLNPRGALARLDPVLEAVRRVRAALGPATALIGFAGAPWTVATYMVEGGSQPRFPIGQGLGLSRSGGLWRADRDADRSDDQNFLRLRSRPAPRWFSCSTPGPGCCPRPSSRAG